MQTQDNGIKRAAIYLRVSTDRQAKEGDSIPAQRDALRRYVEERDDLILFDEYMDDGVSGTKFGERDELQRLLNDVREKKVDVILFTKLDRWYRSIRHYAATQEYLDRYGVSWTAIWEPIYDTTTAAGRLIVNQMMSIAQFEAENTSQRIKSVFDYKVSQGEYVGGNVPIGYSVMDKRLVPNEDASKAVMIFEKFRDLGNVKQTMLWARDNVGVDLTYRTFRYMLSNERYIGRHHGIEGFCPAIIDRDLFETVQNTLNANTRYRPEHTYLFSGLLFCSCCGYSLAASAHRTNHIAADGSKKSYTYMAYICGYHRRENKCDNNKHYSENKIERYLVENLEADLDKFAIECDFTVKAERRAEAEKKRKNIEHKLQKLKELFLNDAISISEYKKDKAELMEKLNAIEDEKPDRLPDIGKIRQQLSGDWRSIYDGFTREEKKAFWRSIIKKIVITPQRDYTVFFAV